MYRAEAKLGRSAGFRAALDDGLLRGIQADRIRYGQSRNLALRATSLRRRDFIDNRNGNRLLTYFEKGLLGSGSTHSKAEVNKWAETAARRVVESSVTTDEDRPALPITREVETYKDGSPIEARSGGVWRGHVCKYCAHSDPPRWPGHHPSQCDRNPATIGWRDNS